MTDVVNLGDIVFGLGPDTSRLRTALRAILDFGDAVEQVAQSEEDGARRVEAAMRKQEAAIVSAITKMQNFNSELRRIGAPANLVKGTQDAFRQLNVEMTQGALTPLQYQRAMEQFNTSMARNQRTLRDWKSEQQAAKQAQQGLGTQAQRDAELFQQQTVQVERARQALLNFESTIARMGAPAQLSAGARGAFGALPNSLAYGVAAPKIDFSKQMSSFNSALAESKRAMGDWRAAQSEVISTGGRFTGMLQQLATAASLTTGPLGGLAFRLNLLSRLMDDNALHLALWVGGIAGVVIGLDRLSKAVTETEMGLARTRLQLYAFTNSEQQMRIEMRELMDVANQFGAPFEDVAQHFAKLELATRGTRLEGAKTRDLFKDMIAYATNMGLAQQQVDATFNLVTRSMSQQVLTLRNLRGEAKSVIPAFESIAAQALNVNTATFESLLKRGQVLGESFWLKFFEAANKRYNIDPSKTVNTIFSAQGRLANAILEVDNAFNQALGVTSSYQKSLELITEALHWLTWNMDSVIKVTGALGAAFIAGFAGAKIIAAIQGISMAVVGLARALAAADIAAAILSGGFTAILGVASAIAAGVTVYSTLNDMVGKNKEKLIGATESLHEYNKQWQLANETSSTHIQLLLQDAAAQLTNAQAALAAALAQKAQIDAQSKQAGDEAGKDAGKSWIQSFLDAIGSLPEQSASIEAAISSATSSAAAQSAANIGKTISDLRTKIKGLQDDIAQGMKNLQETLNREANAKGNDHLRNSAQNQWITIHREYKQLLDETNMTFSAMQRGPRALQETLQQIQLDKTLEQWRKKFQDLGYSSSQVETKVSTLRDALKRLADAKQFDKDFKSLGQTLEYSFGELGKSAMDKFVDAMNNGTLKSMKFKDFVMDALSAIEKKILELAVLNPILNNLFGSTNQTFSLFGGGTGTGGLIGQLLSAVGLQGGGGGSSGAAGSALASAFLSQHGGSGTSAYDFVNPMVFAGAPRLHSGLMPDEFPAILQKGEGVTPKGYQVQPNRTVVNVITPPGSKVDQKKRTSGGVEVTDLIISSVNKGIIDRRFSKSLGSQYDGISAKGILR